MLQPTITRRRIRLWAVVLAMAWLPGVSFFGHWGDLVRPIEEVGATTMSHDHADHCHVDLGDCGAQGGGGEMPAADELAVAVPSAPPTLDAGDASARVIAPYSQTIDPLSPPPRSV